jgi:hypothetical protein
MIVTVPPLSGTSPYTTLRISNRMTLVLEWVALHTRASLSGRRITQRTEGC